MAMNEIFRLNNTVRRDPQIERWFTGSTDPHRLMVRGWFERMRGLGPDVRELFHDGCPVACVSDAPFGYVDAFKAYASVGFFTGRRLPILPLYWRARASACVMSNCAPAMT
jgi:hypothetical protein